MKISYNPLKHLLVDKKMSMNTLAKLTGLSSATMAKLSREEGANINTEVLLRICKVLDCDLTEIMRLERPTTEEQK